MELHEVEPLELRMAMFAQAMSANTMVQTGDLIGDYEVEVEMVDDAS